jgi:NTP pyrophosphatase (non-canonical NTP hydrolase)
MTANPKWRPEVEAFADRMEAKLRENDWKGGWKGCTDLDLFERLGEESAELLSALHRHAKRLSWGEGWVMETDTEERIGREAADVANFAMMIADVCGALQTAPTPEVVAEGTHPGRLREAQSPSPKVTGDAS